MIRIFAFFLLLTNVAVGKLLTPTILRDQKATPAEGPRELQGCPDPTCPIPAPHPPHSHHNLKEKVPAEAALGKEGCPDPTCPIPAPHPPHSRDVKEEPAQAIDRAGCPDPTCPIPAPHPPHNRDLNAEANKDE